MNKMNIQQFYLDKQDTKEGAITMERFSRTKFIRSIIQEHGHYEDGSYCLDVRTLSLADKRIAISHVADSEEHEIACSSVVATEAIFEEHRHYVQSLVNDECFDVYKEAMEEMGAHMGHYPDNNEIYWSTN